MSGLLPRAAAILALAMACLGCPGPAAAQPSAAAPEQQSVTIVRDVPYPGATPGDRRRSLDLYLPADRKQKPPLLIFVHGGFWLLDDDRYQIGPALAQALAREGVAVALLRYRLAPGARHPAPVEDVAAGIALLVRQADRHEYDPRRIFIAGHSAGGHLAALVALDPRYLGRHHLAPSALAGVVSFSGIYDLSLRPGISDNQRDATRKAFGTDPAVLAQASPVRHVSAGAPPFLVLGAHGDFPEFLPDARRFAEALTRAGQKSVDRWIVPGRDHFSLVNLEGRDNVVRHLVLDFLKVQPPPAFIARWSEAKRRWRDPPFSTLPFWRHANLIRSYPVDARFVSALVTVFTAARHELLEWPLERFHAIALPALLAALPAATVGQGDYLVATNVHGEKRYWKLAELLPYQPVVVVGLDDEKDLFRLSIFYHPAREYSWKDGPAPPVMARSVGAFVYLRKEPPEELASHLFGLTESSFHRVPADPLAGLRGLPREVFDAVTTRNGCVQCHQWRGIGAQMHHLTATAGAPHGGMGLPLESYPPEVWKAFLYDNETVARTIGASPNPVDEPARQALYDLVNASRGATPAPAPPAAAPPRRPAR